MFPLTNYCLILAVSSVLALEILALDKDEISNAERMSYELFRNYGGHKDLPVQERQINSQDEPFDWSDCGGLGSRFRLKSLSISPLPLHAPGSITIAFNATVKADIAAPISVAFRVGRRDGGSWVSVCKDIPGGCDWKDICDIQTTAAAAAAAEQDSYVDGSRTPICPLKMGDFSLPPTTFALPVKLPSGLYKVTAVFRKEKKQIACITVNLNIG